MLGGRHKHVLRLCPRAHACVRMITDPSADGNASKPVVHGGDETIKPYSSLFVTNKYAVKMLSLIQPEVKLQRFEDKAFIQRLVHSIHMRGLDTQFDVKDIQDKVGQMLRLKQQADDCRHEMRKLKRPDGQDKQPGAYASVKQRLVCVNESIQQLEDELIPILMKLPNVLQPEVKEAYELVQVKSTATTKHDFKVLSAKQISYINQIRQHSIIGPHAEYWIGSGSKMHRAVRKYFKNELKSLLQDKQGQWHEMSGLDMVKSAIVEACNVPHVKEYAHDKLRLNRGISTTPYSQQMHLTGHCSIESVSAMLSKRHVNFDVLPVRFLQDGANYDQNIKQTDGLHLLSVTGHRPHHLDKECEMMLDVIWRLYEKLGLPVMLCNMGAKLLPANQQAGHEILIYFPYEREWKKAADIRVYGDYLPHRLGLDKLQAIGCDLLNTSLIMDAILENKQDAKGSYSVPQCLLPYM